MWSEIASHPLRPEQVVARAGTRLAPDGAEPLDRICRAAADAGLAPMGRLGLLDRLVSALRTRAALDALPPPPDLRAPPVLLLGMPRSGTTLLHRALAQHPELRAPLLWEVLFPLPLGPRHDPRRDAEDRIRRLRRASPEMERSHALDAGQPEECSRLLEPSLRSVTFWENFPLYGYAEWLTDSVLAEGYPVYARLVRHLAARAPERTLLLKGPAHALALPAFLREFPEARLVWCHRDPAEAQASLDLLTERMHGSLAPDRDDARARAIHRAWMVRAMDNGDTDAVHVRHTDLLADPDGTLRRVQEAIGVPVRPVALSGRRPAQTLAPAAFTVAERARVTRYRERYL